jgi:hypothetical protein
MLLIEWDCGRAIDSLYAWPSPVGSRTALLAENSGCGVGKAESCVLAHLLKASLDTSDLRVKAINNVKPSSKHCGYYIDSLYAHKPGRCRTALLAENSDVECGARAAFWLNSKAADTGPARANHQRCHRVGGRTAIDSLYALRLPW